MEIIKSVAHFVAYIVEGAAVLVILIGSMHAIIVYLWCLFLNKADLTTFMQSRYKLGMSLSLGLGFLVGLT